ncbi:hypothetical protein F5888DRAFT_891332 [Russula emetica]|nr:hypothetical protein F5888DRAFT_891332 [Russula emetica]
MDFSHSPYFAAAPPPPSLPTAQNSNSSAPGHDNNSNLTSGTADPQPQNQSPRQLALSYPQHTPTFRAPAHIRAHHLHSIPPRQKSTWTLIIDHLLWVHAVTRFAQARAELAMTDRTPGGPGTPNFERRERPEQWDENELVTSEGEQDDVGCREIRSRSGGSEHVHDQVEGKGPEMTSRQDLPYARKLRQRAESLEYVVTSMLEQPPRDIPFPQNESIPPTTLQQPPPSVMPSPVRKQILPNAVRLRLALSTIINDLFARHAPVQRHLHFQGGMPTLSSSSASGSNSGASSSRRTTQSSLSSSAPSPVSLLRLPQSLVPLLSVSGTSTTVSSILSPNPQESHANTLILCPRVRGIFAAGATYPITASPSSSPRCPRHLHHSCEICIASDRAHRTTRPRGASHLDSNPIVAQGGGITGFAEGVGVGSGLARSGGGTLLRREIISPPPPLAQDDDETYPTDHLWTRTQGAGDTILTGLIPRFVRLSALVALELGREIGAEATGPGTGTSSGSGSNNNDGQRAVGPAGTALVPTVQWYLLLAGLLTRAVFEGYLTAEWRGLEPLQVLLGFGLGGFASSHDADDDDDVAVRRSRPIAVDEKYVEFEPDGMPNLSDAVDVLFPSRRANTGVVGGGIGDESRNGDDGEEGRGNDDRVGSGRNGDAAKLGGGEAEYAREMGQRLARFLDIPSGTRDLTRHLEDLTCRYPVEPVERTSLRFCEALAQWRGKPELEKYRKQSPMPSHRITVSPPGALDGGGIGGAANVAVCRAIGRYFVIPARTTATATTATPAPPDVLVSNEEEDGRVVIGRKRAHSAAGATGSDRSASTAAARDRWRERRGYI